jgi:hemerythrin-like domain-containing protein
MRICVELSPCIDRGVKRSEALQSLSREHHGGLTAALRLKRATTGTAREACETFLAFWADEGRDHLRAEEEVLLPAFAAHVSADHQAIVRVLVEHVDLRRRALEIGAGTAPAPAQLRELGERLERHIRHEERVLFPLIEEALPDVEIERLAADLERAAGECGSAKGAHDARAGPSGR